MCQRVPKEGIEICPTMAKPTICITDIQAGCWRGSFGPALCGRGIIISQQTGRVTSLKEYFFGGGGGGGGGGWGGGGGGGEGG